MHSSQEVSGHNSLVSFFLIKVKVTWLPEIKLASYSIVLKRHNIAIQLLFEILILQ